MNNKELLGPLGKDPATIVFNHLSPIDQCHMALASRSLYGVFGKLAHKNIIYSFSVLPEGALEHPIFSKYPPNYPALIKFLRLRASNLGFIGREFLFFDYEDVWPIVAIMGNGAALRELIGNDPKRTDANNKCALDYLAMGGHKAELERWINDFYPDFGPEDSPSLHFYAALGGSEEIVFMLVDEYNYSINDSGGKRGWGNWVDDKVTLLHPALWGRHCALLRRLIDAGGDLNKSPPWQDSLALHAGEMGLWDFYEEFKAKGVDLAFNNNSYLFVEAASASGNQDKMMEFICTRVNIDTGELYHLPDAPIPGEHICHAAIRSGQKAIVDLCVEKGWVDIKGVFSSQRRQVKQENKYPALFVAASYGQIEMFDYLVEKYGLDPKVLYKGSDTVLEPLVGNTTWSNFCYIAQKYFHNQVHTSENVPIFDSIQWGKLYNTQQYIKHYCSENDIKDGGHELIEFATERSKNPYLIKWLKNKVASLTSHTAVNEVEDAQDCSNSLGL